MIGRNHPCPCGSGQKYKRCCGLLIPDKDRLAQSAPDRELDTLEPAARLGEPRATAELGLRYLTADDDFFDPKRGLALIEKAALAGDAEGAFLAATLASTSLWRARNWDEAFDYLLRASRQGHEPAQNSLRILAGGPSGSNIEGENWAGMRDEIDLAAWMAPPALQMICEAPRIQIIENFMPAAACDRLVAGVQARLSRATIYDQVTGGATEDGRRTNSLCDLDIETGGVLTFLLRARIGAITGRPELAMEVPKVLHYQAGETFTEHCDYLDPAVPAFAQELALRGQRTHTFLVYLNDDFTGGDTFFPRINLSYKGAKGDALLLANVNDEGMPDGDTAHIGQPPLSGEKWIFSQWIRDLPRG